LRLVCRAAETGVFMHRLTPIYRMLLALALSAATSFAHAFEVRNYCGDEGVWVHILGGGGPELTDDQAAASYLIWQDGKARVLIDPAPGSSLLFDKTEARFEDLELVLFTHLHVDHVGDFPAYIKGSYFTERTEPLRVFGPTGAAPYPDTETFVQRLIGPEGAFAYLSEFLVNKPKSQGGYKVIAQNIAATGRREWSGYGTERMELRAVPVNHGPVPALAYRIDIGGHSIVFTGDFNNEKNMVPALAKEVDALIIHHAVPENTRGPARNLHVVPSQIGRIAEQADPRMVILGHRMNRTRGVESLSRQKIEASYDGSLIFANDMECWGL
jgi:ribonuclease BN (tRNA processing enzyme)